MFGKYAKKNNYPKIFIFDSEKHDNRDVVLVVGVGMGFIRGWPGDSEFGISLM